MAFNALAALFAPDQYTVDGKNPTPFQPQQLLTGPLKGQSNQDYENSLMGMLYPSDPLSWGLLWKKFPEYSPLRIMGHTKPSTGYQTQNYMQGERRMDPGQVFTGLFG